MLYWVFKYLLFTPAIRLLFRPWIEGADNIPRSGPAIVASNHIGVSETLIMPAMIRRRMTFPVKSELFKGKGIGTAIVAWFLRAVGQQPMDRAGGRASASSMDGVLSVLTAGNLLGIYPEGTRSPDGRLYRGKTGVARLVLNSGVPVVPVGVVNTQTVRTRLGIPWVHRPGLRIGRPLDFSAYASAANDRDVLRWVTDEIMNAIMELSGQVYVDAYASSVKEALATGRQLDSPVLSRPGAGRTAPSPPVAPATSGLTTESRGE